MSMGESYGRHRMDRSLDEIAAEMNSGQGSSSVPFGQGYEGRDYIGAPIKGASSSSSRRSAPYSTSSRDRGRDRRREGSLEREDTRNNNRIFVANLSYGTTWQMLKDHMRRGELVGYCVIILSIKSSNSCVQKRDGQRST